VAIIDKYDHASIIDGCRLSFAGETLTLVPEKGPAIALDLADIDASVIQRAKKDLPRPHLHPMVLNVTEREKLSRWVKDAGPRAIASALPHYCSALVAEVARECEAHYFDLTEDVERIVIDSHQQCDRMREMIGRISRRSVAKVRLYSESQPVFDRFNNDNRIIHQSSYTQGQTSQGKGIQSKVVEVEKGQKRIRWRWGWSVFFWKR
jgi:hypothetical protein